MISQCWCCYNVKTIGDEWCDIGLPGMIREFKRKDGKKIEVSHGLCEECFEDVMHEMHTTKVMALTATNGVSKK